MRRSTCKKVQRERKNGRRGKGGGGQGARDGHFEFIPRREREYTWHRAPLPPFYVGLAQRYSRGTACQTSLSLVSRNVIYDRVRLEISPRNSRARARAVTTVLCGSRRKSAMNPNEKATLGPRRSEAISARSPTKPAAPGRPADHQAG